MHDLRRRQNLEQHVDNMMKAALLLMLVWQVTCDFKHVKKKNIDLVVRTGYLRRNGTKDSVISTQTGNADYV